MSEGLLHVQERNRRWEAGDMRAAWSENLILEKYYPAVLDTPSYISKTGHRWPPRQRADAEGRLGSSLAGALPYESRADAAEGRHFIRVWSPGAFWIVVTLCVCGILAASFGVDRRRADG
jgi:hypothetical protein